MFKADYFAVIIMYKGESIRELSIWMGTVCAVPIHIEETYHQRGIHLQYINHNNRSQRL